MLNGEKSMKKLSAMVMACLLGATVAVGMPGSTSYAETPVSEDNVVVTNDNSIFKVSRMRKDNMLDQYRLFKYDKIQIISMGHSDDFGANTTTSTAGDIMIGVDGVAQIPYVGNIKLAGLTLSEAKDVIQAKLSKYFKLSEFNVYLKEYGARKVYVMGNVNDPGIKSMSVDNMNVYAAISSAGGVDKRGRSKHVQILRQVDNTLYFREVNLDGFVKRHDMTQNIVIEDGDIVYVPDSGKVVWSEDIAPYINIYSVYRSIVR